MNDLSSVFTVTLQICTYMWYFDLLSAGFEKYISHEEANHIWLHSGVNFKVIVSLSQKAIIDQAMCLVIPWVRDNF